MAISMKIPPHPASATNLFFKICLGGYTPDLVNFKKTLIALNKRIVLKIKKMRAAIFILLVPLFNLKKATNCCNYLYVYPSIPMNKG
jgi:hypothetical protein